MKHIYNWFNMKNFRRGFTLTEMLTVVLIVGILMSIAVPQYRRTVRRARINEAIAMLDVLAKTSERLMTSWGYRTIAALNTSGNYSFTRLDMLDQNTLPCSVSATEIECTDFTYTYGVNGTDFYLQAEQKSSRKDKQEGSGDKLRLYPDRWSTDANYITCVASEVDCDLYGYPMESAGS